VSSGDNDDHDHDHDVDDDSDDNDDIPVDHANSDPGINDPNLPPPKLSTAADIHYFFEKVGNKMVCIVCK